MDQQTGNSYSGSNAVQPAPAQRTVCSVGIELVDRHCTIAGLKGRTLIDNGPNLQVSSYGKGARRDRRFKFPQKSERIRFSR